MLIVLIAFPFLIWNTYRRMGMGKASAAWPKVQGVVTAAEKTKVAWRTQPLVSYSYEVQGQAYSSKRINCSDTVPPIDTYAILARYPVEQIVTVYYKPDDPATAVLEPGPNAYLSRNFRNLCVIFAIILAVNIAEVALVVYNARQGAQKSTVHTYGDGSDSAPAGTPDLKLGNKLLREDAEKGNAQDQVYVGIWYLSGTMEGYAKDPVEAMKWFRKAAEQGNAQGQNMLGQLYAKGEGVEKDLTVAVEWLQKSAAQGEPHACLSLGYAYEKGAGGLPVDKQKAIEYYRKAGEIPQAKDALKRLGAQ